MANRVASSFMLGTEKHINGAAQIGRILNRNGYTPHNRDASIEDLGHLCSVKVLNANPFGGISQKLQKSPLYFLRVNSMSVTDKVLNQVRQAFDGIYVGIYGGGLSRISVSGITKLWTGSLCRQDGIRRTVEINNLRQLMTDMASARGLVFAFHDGFRARQWKVIPSTFDTSKNVNNNNLESYSFSFLGASFNQKLSHVETQFGSMQQFSGSTAYYHVVQVI